MKPAPAPSFVACVLTWRNYQLAHDCIESLTRSSSWPFPVVVVDNASGTGEGDRLAAEFAPHVTALILEANGGTPAGYNAAIRWAAERGADQILLLNNDTISTDPEMVNQLLAAAAPDVAGVSPLIKTPAGGIQSAGGTLSWRTGRAGHLSTAGARASSGPYEMDWLEASCLLVSLPAARAAGGFADDFFLYWDDVDWCVRARRAGFRCLVQPATSIVHLGTASISNATQRQYWMRNKLLFMRRNAGLRDNAWTVVAFVFRTVPYHVLRQGMAPRRWLAVLRSGAAALSWNVADAIARRSWRVPADGPSIADDLTAPDIAAQV